MRFAPIEETWLNSSFHEKWYSDKMLRSLESLGRRPAQGRKGLDQGPVA